MEVKKVNKKAQVTLFIIIAIVIVVAIVGIFAFRDKIFVNTSSSEFQEVYDYFDSCVERVTLDGIKIAESQGGYIQVPNFEPGSEYAPFSNQLDFLGQPVPYWYYISNNGVMEEQIPTRKEIENQLEEYVEKNIKTCDFSILREKGYEINTSNAKASVSISKNVVGVSLDMPLSLSRNEKSEIKSKHNVNVFSKLGKFYDLANEIYNKEKENSFLENYSIDVMYNYAPVTDVEISCSPKVWNAQDVANDLKSGLSANIGAIKLEGDYYSLKNKNSKYFVVPVKTDESVSFIYDQRWPSRVEIWPAENNILVAEPVGLEEGLGLLGFCYVPYHFVYDIYYPVLVQVYDEKEIFQFPLAVVIDKSNPRQSLDTQNNVQDEIGICNYPTTSVDVYTFDSNLQPVESTVEFQCFNDLCNMGSTSIKGGDAHIKTNFPSCINGKIIAKAEGYVSQEYLISTNTPGVANILMDKLYDLNLEVVAGGLDIKDRKGQALISFQGEKYSASAFYPEQTSIKLAEGFYNVSVQVFSDSSLTIPASTTSNCVQVHKPGIFGFFGQTQEQCFTVNIPAQTLGSALSAGGKSTDFILESDLRSSNNIKISVPNLPAVTSLDQLQANYQLIDYQNIALEFT